MRRTGLNIGLDVDTVQRTGTGNRAGLLAGRANLVPPSSGLDRSARACGGRVANAAAADLTRTALQGAALRVSLGGQTDASSGRWPQVGVSNVTGYLSIEAVVDSSCDAEDVDQGVDAHAGSDASLVTGLGTAEDAADKVPKEAKRI